MLNAPPCLPCLDASTIADFVRNSEVRYYRKDKEHDFRANAMISVFGISLGQQNIVVKAQPYDMAESEVIHAKLASIIGVNTISCYALKNNVLPEKDSGFLVMPEVRGRMVNDIDECQDDIPKVFLGNAPLMKQFKDDLVLMCIAGNPDASVANCIYNDDTCELTWIDNEYGVLNKNARLDHPMQILSDYSWKHSRASWPYFPLLLENKQDSCEAQKVIAGVREKISRAANDFSADKKMLRCLQTLDNRSVQFSQGLKHHFSS